MPADRSNSLRATHGEQPTYKRSFTPSGPCEICDATFRRAGDLTRHMRTVHSTRVLSCDIEDCNYKTTQKPCLETHRRRHFGIKEFKCTDEPGKCYFETCDRSSLHRHRVRMHGYVSRPIAKRSRPPSKEGAKRPNPHRVPVRVIRTIKESDSSSSALSQFSSFSSGSSSTTKTSAPSTPSASADSLSDLSDLTEQSDSESGSDSERPTPNVALSPSVTPCSLPSVAELPISAYPMIAPQYHFLPQAADDFNDVLTPSTSKIFAGEEASPNWLHWLRAAEGDVKLEPLSYDQYLNPLYEAPYTQLVPGDESSTEEKPWQADFDLPEMNPTREAFVYSNSTPSIVASSPMAQPHYQEISFDNALLQSAYGFYSPSAQSENSSSLPATQSNQASLYETSSQHNDSVNELDISDVAVEFEEEFDPTNWNLDYEPTASTDPVNETFSSNPPVCPLSNALDTSGVAVDVSRYNQEQFGSAGRGFDLQLADDWSFLTLGSQSNALSSSFDSHSLGFNQYLF